MTFLNRQSDGKKMVDKVFKAAVKASAAKVKFGPDQVVDATLGTLFDETETFCAFDSVWDTYKTIPNIQKAKYAASIQGNPSFQKDVKDWLFGGIKLNAEVLATPGGAGAVSSTIKNVLEPGQILIKPSLAWGPYKTMAAEFGNTIISYNLFKEGKFDIDSFKSTLSNVMDKQQKVLAIINDPCHNPSGYTMSSDEWNQVITFLNQLSDKGPVILLHDIAYVDFSTNPSWKEHFAKYAALNKNVMVVIAFSLSKTFTAYGARLGAAVAVTNNQEELQKFIDAGIYSARSIWSTVNNSMMELFTKINRSKELYDTYMLEKQKYIDLLKERANIFIGEANEVGLPLYPFKEGFFATIEVSSNQEKERLSKILQDNNIFTVEVDNGLRVALCSVSKEKLKGLASKIKNLM
jgi:aspartate aminotransferase/aromatic-amino-acid transaminase